jgi:hypothetical protein
MSSFFISFYSLLSFFPSFFLSFFPSLVAERGFDPRTSGAENDLVMKITWAHNQLSNAKQKADSSGAVCLLFRIREFPFSFQSLFSL